MGIVGKIRQGLFVPLGLFIVFFYFETVSHSPLPKPLGQLGCRHVPPAAVATINVGMGVSTGLCPESEQAPGIQKWHVGLQQASCSGGLMGEQDSVIGGQSSGGSQGSSETPVYDTSTGRWLSDLVGPFWGVGRPFPSCTWSALGWSAYECVTHVPATSPGTIMGITPAWRHLHLGRREGPESCWGSSRRWLWVLTGVHTIFPLSSGVCWVLSSPDRALVAAVSVASGRERPRGSQAPALGWGGLHSL